jgi:hypothetical protein
MERFQTCPILTRQFNVKILTDANLLDAIKHCHNFGFVYFDPLLG